MAELRYRVRITDSHTHNVQVELTADGVAGPATLVMPSWTPGSYLMREFARNVTRFQAADGSGTPLPFQKTDKGAWRVDAPADGTLHARWTVHADELTVRTSHVDASHAYLNGTSIFLYLDGRQGEPATVRIDAPPGWRITTALPAVDERTFHAADYDELADSPFEIGTHEVVRWSIDGVPHQYALWGRGNADPARLQADTTRIVLAERDIFRGLPYPEFTFILHLATGGGGLEHRNSTSLLADRWSFRGLQYESFLGLAAHELFHAWNGKRIRPAALGPFDYTRENYTRDLWVVEGITTYYTDLLLRRAGLISQQRYLDKLAESITRFQAIPGRAVQPLADASFDTWIKFYRPDANTPNATISYYQKGALVALLLDLEIRRATGNARSMDDLMRLLWERYGAADVGFAEGAVEAAAEEVAGVPLRAFFDHAVRSTGELDYAAALAAAGLALLPAHQAAAQQTSSPGAASATTSAASAGTTGGASTPPAVLPAPPAPQEAQTGLTLRGDGSRVFAMNVLDGTAASRAGVNAGDELVALDGFRITSPDWLSARLMERPRGSSVALTVFRRDEMLSLQLPVEWGPPQRLVLRPAPDATPAQAALRAGWLRTAVPDDAVPPAAPTVAADASGGSAKT